jgi:hypothetical protein
MVGSISERNPSHIRFGSVPERVPLMNRAMTTSSHEAMNASSAPAMTPGRISGKVTCRNARQGVAPRLKAACSSRSSTRWSVAETVTMT